MNNLISIINRNGNLVVSSRVVARDFEKRNSEVNRAIENYMEVLKNTDSAKLHTLFIENEYTTEDANGVKYKEYLLTRDGFSLLVMGFTGSKALKWKLKYIEAFNKMEQEVRNNQVLTQNLSPQLQLLINMELKQKEIEVAITETREEIQAIRDVIVVNPKAEWRKETNDILKNIGKTMDDYSRPRNEVYEALKERANCRPSVLIKNLKKRALENGMAPSKADKLNLLDVLENEPRLREIYINIVKQMAIKYGV